MYTIPGFRCLFHASLAVLGVGAALLCTSAATLNACGPVSYTHLDVYKRQAVYSTAASSAPSPSRSAKITGSGSAPPRGYFS